MCVCVVYGVLSGESRCWVMGFRILNGYARESVHRSDVDGGMPVYARKTWFLRLTSPLMQLASHRSGLDFSVMKVVRMG
jgi:hypothetical protein